MGIEIKLPILIKVDNVGAIYVSNNFSLSPRTKHIDSTLILGQNMRISRSKAHKVTKILQKTKLT
jgi:hypothetical protein